MFDDLEFKTVKGSSTEVRVNIRIEKGVYLAYLSKAAMAILNAICPKFGRIEIKVAGNRVFAFSPVMKEKAFIGQSVGCTPLRDNIKGLVKGHYKLVEYKGMLVCDLDNQ